MGVADGRERPRGRQKKSGEALTIEQALGVAIGQMGMSLSDFCSLDVEEFEQAAEAWSRMQEMRSRENWETARTLAYTSLAPHLKSGSGATPKSLFPMPWDNEEAADQPTQEKIEMSAEEQRERMEKLAERLGVSIKKSKTQQQWHPEAQ